MDLRLGTADDLRHPELLEQRRRQEGRIRALRAVADPIDDVLFRLAPPLRRLAQLVVVRFGKNPARV